MSNKYIKVINNDIKDTEKNARVLYSNMLKSVWEKIRRLNKQGKTSYTYNAPIFLSNQKLYAMDEYIVYIIRKFRAGGMTVRFFLPNIILISWIDNRATESKLETLDFLLEEDTKSKLLLATSGDPEYEKKYKSLLEYTKQPLLLTETPHDPKHPISPSRGGRLIGRKK